MRSSQQANQKHIVLLYAWPPFSKRVHSPHAFALSTYPFRCPEWLSLELSAVYSKHILLSFSIRLICPTHTYNTQSQSRCAHDVHTWLLLALGNRSAAEELVRSQFSAFKNMPSPGIQLERRSQPRLGGSTASLNKLVDPMSTSLTLNCRNSSSISDLSSTELKKPMESPPVQVHVPMPTPKTQPAEPETPSRGSKFAPANIFKSFFK